MTDAQYRTGFGNHFASEAIPTFLATLTPADHATVHALRTLIRAAHPDLTEHIKWNAPSFCLNGDDRITLGVERKGGIRVVLHRGAKPKDATGFTFADTHSLAAWPSPDRGVMIFSDEAEVRARAAVHGELFTRWLAATV